MTTPDDLTSLFKINPETPRAVCFGTDTGLLTASEDSARAVGVTAQLLFPDSFEPSDKWLVLELQPVHAMILARCILEVAKKKGWPEPDVEIVGSKLSTDKTIH